MKQTIAAFAAGAMIASGIAIFMNRKPEPAPQPAVAVVETAKAPVPAATAEPAPPAAPSRVEAPAATAPRAKVRVKREERAAKPVAAAPAPERAAPVATPAPAPAAAPVVVNSEPAPAPAPAAEAKPRVALNPPPGTVSEAPAKAARVPHTLTIPEGTLLAVRLSERVSTEVHVSGDTFSATLAEPLVIDGFAIAERNARIEGRVVQSDKGGRVRGQAFLSVELTHLSTSDGQKVAIHTATFERKGEESSKREDAKKVGVGAAIGAAIGAIAGGGKGAAIGAGAGGAAGGGVVLATRGGPAELPVETRISFKLSQPVTLTEKLTKSN
jgi:hypothetical protein